MTTHITTIMIMIPTADLTTGSGIFILFKVIIDMEGTEIIIINTTMTTDTMMTTNIMIIKFNQC